ncbi:MAG: hypothetical protein MMC33_010052 [Icmadophila ericetorum]|nr:hypothetical protein [Icmadophila ericetorum]
MVVSGLKVEFDEWQGNIQNSNNSEISKAEYKGTIEVVVLRCYPSEGSSSRSSNNKNQGKGPRGGGSDVSQKQREKKYSTQETQICVGGDGTWEDSIQPLNHNGARRLGIQMTGSSSGMYLPRNTNALNQNLTPPSSSRSDNLMDHPTPQQQAQTHSEPGERIIPTSGISHGDSKNRAILLKQELREFKAMDILTAVDEQAKSSDKPRQAPKILPKEPDEASDDLTAGSKLPGTWTEEWTANVEKLNDSGIGTHADNGCAQSTNLGADNDSWADQVEAFDFDKDEVSAKDVKEMQYISPQWTKSVYTPKANRETFREPTLLVPEPGPHDNEFPALDLAGRNWDSHPTLNGTGDADDAPNSTACGHNQFAVNKSGFADLKKAAERAETSKRRENQDSTKFTARAPFHSDPDVKQVPHHPVEYKHPVRSQISQKEASDTDPRRQASSSKHPSNARLEPTHPGDGTAKDELANTMPIGKAERKNVHYQIQSGKPTTYVHKTASPAYMDTAENPYALFTFHYRSVGKLLANPIELNVTLTAKALLEKELNITVIEVEAEEKERLQTLPKDEIIEYYLRAKALAQKQQTNAVASNENQGGWTGSVQSPGSVAGSVKSANGNADGFETANYDATSPAAHDVANHNPDSSSHENQKHSNRGRSQNRNRSQKGKQKSKNNSTNESVGGTNHGLEWNDTGVQSTAHNPNDSEQWNQGDRANGSWNQAETGNDNWDQTGTAKHNWNQTSTGNENWNGIGVGIESWNGGEQDEQANGGWNGGGESNMRGDQAWESNGGGAGETTW